MTPWRGLHASKAVMIQGGEEEEKGGEGRVGPLGVGEGLSSLRVWLACRHVDVSAHLQLGMLACQHSGVLVWRHAGLSAHWYVGLLVLWCFGVPAHCHVGMSVLDWCNGTLVSGCTVMLACGHVGTYKWGRQCTSVYFVVERESVHKGTGSGAAATFPYPGMAVEHMICIGCKYIVILIETVKFLPVEPNGLKTLGDFCENSASKLPGRFSPKILISVSPRGTEQCLRYNPMGRRSGGCLCSSCPGAP